MHLRSAVIGPALLITFAIGCGAEKDKDAKTSTIDIKPSLQRIEADSYAGLTDSRIPNLVDNGATKTTIVTIKSLKYPIGAISLSDEPPAGQTASAGGNNSMEIYTCAGTTNDECLVELTGEALKDLLNDAPPQTAIEGTYSQVNISPCINGANPTDAKVKLTAETTIEGVPYYTNAAKGLSTTGPAEEVVFSPYVGCNSVRFLTKDIVIGEDSFSTVERKVGGEEADAKASGELSEQLNIKFYFDLANAIIAAGPSSDSNASNETADGSFCKGDTSRVNPYICLNFPEIVGTVDEGTPSLTRMLINDSTIWGFYSSSEGTPFGAYQRSFYKTGIYNNSNEPAFLVGSMFERFQVNSDGSISFQQYDDGQNRHIRVANFKLSDHSGTFTQGTATKDYTAVKLP